MAVRLVLYEGEEKVFEMKKEVSEKATEDDFYRLVVAVGEMAHFFRRLRKEPECYAIGVEEEDVDGEGGERWKVVRGYFR